MLSSATLIYLKKKYRNVLCVCFLSTVVQTEKLHESSRKWTSFIWLPRYPLKPVDEDAGLVHVSTGRSSLVEAGPSSQEVPFLCLFHSQAAQQPGAPSPEVGVVGGFQDVFVSTPMAVAFTSSTAPLSSPASQRSMRGG